MLDWVVTRTDILENEWDPHHEGSHDVVEVYVGYLRRKIDAPFGLQTIETVRGLGYRLSGTNGQATGHRHAARTTARADVDLARARRD